MLDGIQYPIVTSPILTDFVFVRDHLPKNLKSDANTLSYIGDALFSDLAKQPGVKMTAKAPIRIHLHGGNAIEFSGSIPASGFGGKKTGFASYILLGPGNTEWQIEFRTASGHLSADAPLFREIADSLGVG